MEQPSKQDIEQFLTVWEEMNLAERMQRPAPKPTEAEHAAFRRVAIWLNELAR